MRNSASYDRAPLVKSVIDLAQRLDVVRMQQRLDIGRGHLEARRIDAENPILAIVPHPVAVDPVPIPGPHLAGRDRHAAPLLAFDELGGRSLELRRARAHAVFQLGIEALQLPGLAIELGENLDLGAQHLGHDRHRDVVDGAHLVTAQTIDVADLDRRDEDHRRLLEPRMLADHGGELEPVQFRHADVDQDDGDLVLEQDLERLASRSRDDEILAEFLQDRPRRPAAWPADRRPEGCLSFHGPSSKPPVSDAATCEWREEAARC